MDSSGPGRLKPGEDRSVSQDVGRAEENLSKRNAVMQSLQSANPMAPLRDSGEAVGPSALTVSGNGDSGSSNDEQLKGKKSASRTSSGAKAPRGLKKHSVSSSSQKSSSSISDANDDAPNEQQEPEDEDRKTFIRKRNAVRLNLDGSVCSDELTLAHIWSRYTAVRKAEVRKEEARDRGDAEKLSSARGTESRLASGATEAGRAH